MPKFKNLLFPVILTILAAILLSILPIPKWATPFWPVWPLLALIYWCLALPEKYGIKFAWCIGILMDLLKNTLIGQHALAYTLTIYMVAYFYPRFRIHSLLEQSIGISIFLFPYFFLTIWIEGMLYPQTITWQQWTPIISSALLWPWVFSILRLVRHRATT